MLYLFLSDLEFLLSVGHVQALSQFLFPSFTFTFNFVFVFAFSTSNLTCFDSKTAILNWTPLIY